MYMRDFMLEKQTDLLNVKLKMENGKLNTLKIFNFQLSIFNSRVAFTLAEVLITLAVIGVVAAMTMPTLINQTNGAQYKAAFKKSLSAISQAVTLNVAMDDISFADTSRGAEGSAEPPANGVSVASLLNGRMKVVNITATNPYTSYPSYPSGVTTNFPTTYTFMFFNDGSMFSFGNNLEIGTKCHMGTRICWGFIDVNGIKGPNKPVVCDTLANTKQDEYTTGTIVQSETACTVKTPTDIYPVFYYDQTIVPATNAGRAVLYGK